MPPDFGVVVHFSTFTSFSMHSFLDGPTFLSGLKTSTHTHQLYSLGPLAGKQAHTISIQQPKPGSGYKQGFHKGHNGDAPT